MKLKSVTAGNFKNLAETTIELDSLIAIVSTNNYGKSNLLEAINYGFRFLKASSSERNRMMRWIGGIPLVPSLSGKDYCFSVEFESDDLGESYKYVRYGFSFSWLHDNGGAYITDETIEMRENESVRYTAYLNRAKESYRPTKESKAFRKLTLAGDVLAIDILSGMEGIDIAKVISAIRNLNCRMCNTLDLNFSYGLSPVELNNSSHSSMPFDVLDIPKTLSVLQTEYPEKYRLFVGIISDLFPEFGQIDLQKYTLTTKQSPEDGKNESDEVKSKTDVPFHIKNELYQLVVASKYLNQPVSVEMMSTGTQRIIWLVANAVFGARYGLNLIGVEEIETSIHPKMIKTLLESLLDCLEDTTMLVTSHSPYIIQYLKPKHIYIGVPNQEGVAVFKKIRGTKEKALIKNARDLKTPIAEYLFDLMSGGSRSAEVLAAYLED